MPAITITSPEPERRRWDRSQGIPLRRRHGQLTHTLLDSRHPYPEGFDVAAALELYLDRYPTRDGQLVLLRSWLDAAERGELVTRNDYQRVIAHAIETMSKEPDLATAIAILRRRAPRIRSPEF